MATTEPTTSAVRTGIDAEFLAILRCPLTHSKLTEVGGFLVAQTGGMRYPVRDRIPVMLIEEAKLPEDCKTLDEFKTKYCPAVK